MNNFQIEFWKTIGILCLAG